MCSKIQIVWEFGLSTGEGNGKGVFGLDKRERGLMRRILSERLVDPVGVEYQIRPVDRRGTVGYRGHYERQG